MYINTDPAALRPWTQTWPSMQHGIKHHHGLKWYHRPLTLVWSPGPAWSTDTNMDSGHCIGHVIRWLSTRYLDTNPEPDHIKATVTLRALRGHSSSAKSHQESKPFLILGLHQSLEIGLSYRQAGCSWAESACTQALECFTPPHRPHMICHPPQPSLSSCHQFSNSPQLSHHSTSPSLPFLSCSSASGCTRASGDCFCPAWPCWLPAGCTHSCFSNHKMTGKFHMQINLYIPPFYKVNQFILFYSIY